MLGGRNEAVAQAEKDVRRFAPPALAKSEPNMARDTNGTGELHSGAVLLLRGS